MVLALPTPPTLLLEPPLTVVVERLVEPADAELRLPPEVVVPPLRAVLLERLVVALEREVLLERLVLALEREVLLERLVPALEREVLLERLLLALEREDELPELLIVPPIALEVDPLLRLTLAEELLREDPELLRLTLEDEELRETLPEELLRELVWLEDERLLPPLLDWALTGDIASAIAATAASASLNVVFIMLNFSVRKYSLSIWILHISYQFFISARIRDLSPTAEWPSQPPSQGSRPSPGRRIRSSPGPPAASPRKSPAPSC